MRISFRAKSPLASAFAFALVMFWAGNAIAQSAARVEGNVTDKAGAAMPGVTITSTNVGTNQSRTDVTDSNGAYTITPLPVGDYRIQFELSGFKTATVPVTLTVGEVSRIDMKMELGGVSATITVGAT